MSPLNQRIRLRFSGLTLFASRVFSVVMGFVFMITVTRNISTYDFGVWQNIGDMIGYFVILGGILPGWVTRYVARGQENAAATGLFANVALSIPVLIAWLLLAPELANVARTASIYYMVAGALIVAAYLKSVLESIAQAKRPHLLGFDVIIHELTAVSSGILLVVYLKYGLLGAILAGTSSNFADVAFYIVALRDTLSRRVNWTYLRKWLKSSILTLYGMGAERVSTIQLVILMIYGGATARGYFGAAQTIALPISYVSTLTIGLYPKLLAGGSREDVETSIKMIFMFAAPMVTGTIILARSLLSILNPTYAVAVPVLYLTAISYLPWCLANTLTTVLTGTEKIDASDFGIKDLMRSRLSLPYSVWYLCSAISLPLLWFALVNFKPDSLDAAVYTVMVGYVTVPISLAIRYVIAKRYLPFKLPLVEFGKYSIASVLMGIVLLQLEVAPRISAVIPIVAFGASVYFSILLIIDRETRKLIISVIAELRKIRKNGFLRISR